MPTQKELNDQYSKNLHTASIAIVKRDASNNLDPSLNPNVYIEPINWIYENKYINQYIDTNFSYFKFPPRIIVNDIDVPIDTTIVDITDKFNSLYKPQPQYVPVIPLFLPNENDVLINYGWNEKITSDEFSKIRAINPYDEVVFDHAKWAATPESNPAGAKWTAGQKIWTEDTTRLVKPLNDIKNTNGDIITTAGKLQSASIYFRAQENALNELITGESSGRYQAVKGVVGDKYFDVNSLFEGHFQKIKFTKLINGTTQLQDGEFAVTQNLIDSKQSLRFDIQLAISHLDKHARNRFIIRLVKYSTNSSINKPYTVIKRVTSLEQGNSNTTGAFDTIKQTTYELDQLNATKLQLQLEYDTLEKLGLDAKHTLDKSRADLYTAKHPPAFTKVEIQNPIIASAQAKFDADQKVFDDIVAKLDIIEQKQVAINKQVVDTKTNLDSLLKAASINKTFADYSTEEIFIGPSYLYSGKTMFKLSYILKSSDLVLNDVYSIEMLGVAPQSMAHELIEENSYWNIRELPLPVEKYDGAIDWKDNWVTDSTTILNNKNLGDFSNNTAGEVFDPNDTTKIMEAKNN